MSVLEKTSQDFVFLQNMTKHVLKEIKESIESQ